MSESQKWRTKTEYGGFSMTEWRPGYALPARFRTTLDGEHLPYVVELEFVTDDNGVECREIQLTAREGGEPITARGIRSVPVGECIQLAIGGAASPISEKDGVVTIAIGGRSSDFTEPFEMARPVDRRMSDAHLREVADIYTKAGSRPTQAVEHHWAPISYSTAARWVGAARKRGFLSPAREQDKQGDDSDGSKA